MVETPDILIAKEMLSPSTVKRLVVEQESNGLGVVSFKKNCKLQVFILKLRVENYALNFEM